LLSSNISPTCPHNMVNFGPLAAEIVSLVWGTPGNFNGFRVFLHGTLVVGVSQTAALNRGRHLYSAGRLSRWALAHISSFSEFCVLASLLPRRRSTEANQTLHDVWPSAGLVHCIYVFGAGAPQRNFARCKVHFAYKYWQRYCSALE